MRSSSEEKGKHKLLRKYSLWAIFFLVALYFCQLWWEVGGETLRSEDIVIVLLLSFWFILSLKERKLFYRPHVLNIPVLLWVIVIALSVAVTLFKPYEPKVKNDAVVNGVRLMLAYATFFIVYNHPSSSRRKVSLLIRVVIGFSFLTTFISLLQISYWEGWLPFSIPRVLIEKAPGSNMQPGREIFGLFVGDTSAHAWAGMLSLQAMTVFIAASYSRQKLAKWVGYIYFVLLVIIHLRMAVRNSFFGLFAAILVIRFLTSINSNYKFNRIMKPVFMVFVIFIVVVGFISLAPPTYYVQRAKAAIPRLEGGEIEISRASSIYSRLDFYETAARMFRESPIYGHGFFSYQTVSPLYGRGSIHAHNGFMQIFAETGLVGAFVFTVFLAYAFRQVWRIYIQRYLQIDLVIGQELVLGTIIYLCFTALFAVTFWVPQQMSFFLILLACYGPDVL